MLHSVALCYICCIALYCIVLHCIELYCIVLYCIVLYCIVLYIVLYCIVMCCIVLYIVLYCILYCIVYCIVLYCIILYCIAIVLYCSLQFAVKTLEGVFHSIIEHGMTCCESSSCHTEERSEFESREFGCWQMGLHVGYKKIIQLAVMSPIF